MRGFTAAQFVLNSLRSDSVEPEETYTLETGQNYSETSMYTVSSRIGGQSRGRSSTLITRGVVEDNATANGDKKLSPRHDAGSATSSGNDVHGGTSRGNTDEVAASNGSNHDVSAANGSNDDVATANRDDHHLIGGRDKVATANAKHIVTVTRSHIATHGVPTIAVVYGDGVVVALDGDT